MEPLFKRVIIRQEKQPEDVFAEVNLKAYLYKVADDCDDRLKNSLGKEVKYTAGDLVEEDEKFNYLLLHETSLLYFV